MRVQNECPFWAGSRHCQQCYERQLRPGTYQFMRSAAKVSSSSPVLTEQMSKLGKNGTKIQPLTRFLLGIVQLGRGLPPLMI